MVKEITEQGRDAAAISVSARGTPEQVKSGLDQVTGGAEAVAAPMNQGGGVTSALADSAHVVRARRIHPKEDEYGNKYSNYFEYPCPVSRPEIESYAREHHGGKAWHADVVDEEGQRVAGFNFKIHEEPKSKYEDKAKYHQRMGMAGGGMPGMPMPGIDPMGVQGGQAWPELSRGDLGLDEIEGIQPQQEEEKIPFEEWMENYQKRKIMMAEIEGISGKGKQDDSKDVLANALKDISANTTKQIEAVQAASEAKIDVLLGKMEEERRRRDQKDSEDKHSRDLKELSDRHDRQIEELKSSQNQQDPEKTVFEIIRAMKDDDKVFKILADMNKTSQENFKDAIGMFTQNKPENSMEMVNSVMGSFANMASTLGFGKGGDEDLPFEARLLKTVNNLTPEVLKFVREEKQKGRELTREVIEGKIDEVTSGAMDGVKDEVRKAIAEQAGKLMGGGAAIPQDDPAEQKGAVETPKEVIPSDKIAEMFNVEDDIAGRVNQALIIAGREMQIRPAEASWIDFVFENLPEEMIAGLANSPDPQSFLSVFAKHADKQVMAAVVKLIFKDPKARAWMKASAEDFKEAYLEAVRDPSSGNMVSSGPLSRPSPDEATSSAEYVDNNAGMPLDPEGADESAVVYDAPGESSPSEPDPTPTAQPEVIAGPLGSLPQSEATQPPTGSGPLGSLTKEVQPPLAPKKTAPKKAAKKAAPKKAAKKVKGGKK